MKKSILGLMIIVASSTFVMSCSSDDDSGSTCSDGIQNGNETGVDCGGSCTPCNATSEDLSGDITTEVELDAAIAYNLTGALVVKEGGKLTIPAGTVIKATGGTSSYIAVAQGAQIFVNGTADKPVVMTSGDSSPKAADWGGLVVCGKAPSNTGDSSISEVADLAYGGVVANDNSGSIRYLRVEYTGAQHTNSKQFNGVSLFGVGSGTTFEYVQSYNGNDDGIEFFGGTVNGKYLISTNANDDGIDFADGWAGTGENWYVSGSAKAGVEGSNNGDNGDAAPVTNATLKNITVVGPVTEGALYFKEGGGEFTVDNFYTSGVNLGVKVKSTDAEAAVRIEAGKLTITNIQFDAPADGFKYTDYTGAKQDFFTEGAANGAANGAGNGASAPDWAQGWSKGLDNSAPTSQTLEGDITSSITLDSALEYQLTSALVVKDGGTLTIPAGTVIKATGGTSAYIAVAQGGKIFVNGTADNPVIMTSGAAVPAPANWGGLVICGKAPSNTGSSSISEVADLTYGGTVSDDNSGSIQYLRVEYTGAQHTNSKQFNGVSLFGVGSGTTFEYVQSYNGNDDGIEFFGGTVNGKYLISTNANDDGIDFADGWAGTGENWYVSGSAKAGVEGSNNGDNGDATPVTNATLKNITVVGPVTEGALYFKEGGGEFTIENFYTKGVNLGIKVKDSDAEAKARIEAGKLTITTMQFDAPAAGLEKTNYTGAKQDFFTEGATTGAGNGAEVPAWASGWTKF